MEDKQPWIVGSLREVAEFFGVSPQTVKGDWRAAEMPGQAGAWDLAAILRWRDARRRAPPPSESGVELDGKPVTRAKLATLEQLERYRARKLHNDRLAGELVERSKAEQEIAEMALRLRARVEAMPDELQMELPRKLRASLRERLRSKVRLILTEISEWAKGEDNEQQPTRAAANGGRAGATAKGRHATSAAGAAGPAGRRPAKVRHPREGTPRTERDAADGDA